MFPQRLFGAPAIRKRRRFVPMGAAGFRPRRRLMRRRVRGRRAVDRFGELKFLDTDVDQKSIADGSGIISASSINLIAQGADENERIGRKCTIRQILWRFAIENDGLANTTGAQGQSILRVILYHDKQTNGAAAGVTDILETNDYQSFRNLTTTGRFHILMDRTYNVGNGSSAGDGTTNDYSTARRNYTFFKSVNIPLEFTGTTGVIGELTTNNIGILLIKESSTATVSFLSKIRVRFSDN